MNCCCCCTGGGIVLPIGPLLWACGAVWVAENIVAVLIVCAVCGLLALVASILLLRWADRRDAARMAAWRARRAQIGKPITVLRAEVVEHPAGTYGLTEAPCSGRVFRPRSARRLSRGSVRRVTGPGRSTCRSAASAGTPGR